jgi:AhpD family alkylhydroperoxidase
MINETTNSMIKVPSYDEVSLETKIIFDNLKSVSGKVSNLYATIGYSVNALSSYTAFVQAQTKGSFHGKDREAIYLIVSQLNGCEYCLASHTLSALKFKWTEKETLLLRAGKFPENKWQVIFQIIKSVIEKKGEASDELLNAFFETGYKEKELIDLMALINIMTFTNYIYRLTKVPIDYPLAKRV